MPRSPTGSIVTLKDGSIYARVRYLDENRHRKERRKKASNRTDAQTKINQMLRELDEHGPRVLDSSMTFARWIDYYEKTYVFEPQYRGNSKIAGLRSWRRQRSTIKRLRAHFGNQKLRAITYSELEAYRNRRLQDQIAVATLNRELALLRRTLNVALRDGWILRNPFDAGEPLIRPADENHRERILSYDEEDRLLLACTGRREHLRAIVVCALDTGMRRGEIITMVWSDVNFGERTITVQALNTKTIRQRVVPISDRLYAELTWLWEKPSQKTSTQKLKLRVFSIQDNFKRAFATACRDAKIDDLHVHDLRHTAATRLIQGGMSLTEAGRVLGHTQPQTTYRYVNLDSSAIRRAAEILNEIHRRRRQHQPDDSKPS